MTTVAYRDGVIAADTQLSFGSHGKHKTTAKCGRTDDGHLWAFTGDAHHKDSFAKWCEKRKGEPPKFDGSENTGIHVSPEGVIREWFGDGWFTCAPGFDAWGSGCEFAMGAMEMGADARRAVEVACAFDRSSGGTIVTFALHQPAESEGPVKRPNGEIVEEDGTVTREWPLAPASTAAEEAEPTWRQRHGLE